MPRRRGVWPREPRSASASYSVIRLGENDGLVAIVSSRRAASGWRSCSASRSSHCPASAGVSPTPSHRTGRSPHARRPAIAPALRQRVTATRNARSPRPIGTTSSWARRWPTGYRVLARDAIGAGDLTNASTYVDKASGDRPATVEAAHKDLPPGWDDVEEAVTQSMADMSAAYKKLRGAIDFVPASYPVPCAEAALSPGICLLRDPRVHRAGRLESPKGAIRNNRARPNQKREPADWQVLG